MGQTKRIGGVKGNSGSRITAASQNVDDHCGRADTVVECLLAGRIYCCQPVGGNASKDGHHLPIAIAHAFQLPANLLHRCGQNPFTERSAIPQGTGLASQDRHIMPRIVDGLAPAERAAMLRNTHTILANDDPLGIGMDLHRATDCG